MNEHLQRLLAEMPSIANAVNAFDSEAVQLRVLEHLLHQTSAQPLARATAAPPVQRLNSNRVYGSSHGTSRRGYCREVSRAHKALFAFLIDQSFSMEEPLSGTDVRKMDALAGMINGWLQNVVIRATSGEGVKDVMDIAIFGYRTDNEATPILESPFSGALEGKTLVSVSEIAELPARIESRAQSYFDEETGEVVEMQVQVPIWVDAKAEGATPMCSALHKTYGLVEEWISEHPKSFPPVVIHFTDGESSEGDPLPYAEPLKALETDDGAVLLFNCHLSLTQSDPFIFPSSKELLPDDWARVLFDMSSHLPGSLYDRGLQEGYDLQPGARGMAFNADMVALIKFLDMGTRIATTLR